MAVTPLASRTVPSAIVRRSDSETASRPWLANVGSGVNAQSIPSRRGSHNDSSGMQVTITRKISRMTSQGNALGAVNRQLRLL